MEKKTDTLPWNFVGGQRSLIALALMLAAGKEAGSGGLFLLDEVDAALDENNQALVAKLLKVSLLTTSIPIGREAYLHSSRVGQPNPPEKSRFSSRKCYFLRGSGGGPAQTKYNSVEKFGRPARNIYCCVLDSPQNTLSKTLR